MAVNRKGAFFLLLAAALFVGPSSSKTTQPPHIILIVADDLGWNDVSFHGSDQIPTPHLDSLAYSGVILGNYYVSPICTPTRSALMTGRHPIHTGLQHGVISGATPFGLPLNETILPQYLKQLGYATHMVGKWHLGMYAWDYTPTFRGFDSYFGYWTGAEGYMDHINAIHASWHLGHHTWEHTPTYRGFDSYFGYLTGKDNYYDHTDDESNSKGETGYKGLDLRNGTEPVWTENGTYSTELFATEAERIIASHDTDKPLFLYLPHQAVHSGNPDDPLQAPQKYIDKFPHIQHPGRRTFAAMVSALDDAVGNVTKALSARGMLENSVIIFTTDNGGPAAGFDMNYASNWPLRGVKNTLWEGGVHGTGFVHSPLIKQPKRTTHELLHVCDLLPTIYALAGGDSTQLKNLDGLNVWETISRGEESPRVEVLHNIDPKRKTAALRYRDHKIILGEAYKG
ncbi:hypothetical protein Bbelb_286530 [Branchiostoma belcheri]|nr:hypothetical protein Bbelb_286530 [Branchiostoma belcheri]